MYDVTQLLKKYRIFIYTGNRMADLDLMEMELNELNEAKVISKEDFMQAQLIIRKEKRILRTE